MRTHVAVETPVIRTARVMQMEGMFDVPPQQSTHLTWDVDLPLEARPWQVGLIVGPSGSGKTTVAKHLWPMQFNHQLNWSEGASLLDDFPIGMSIKQIIELINSVGFSSPPAWVRPFRVLSTGEQFRVSVARELAVALCNGSMGPDESTLVVLDEFTSVVDRTVAQIGSSAIARTVRSHEGLRFVAVTCHYDVEDWLQPDWVYSPATNGFSWRSAGTRPKSNSLSSAFITPLGSFSGTITI